MPISSENVSPSTCDGQAAIRRTDSAAPRAVPQAGLSSGGDGRCVACEVRNGLPVVRGKVRGHYVSHQGGSRMLILERGRGECIRINDTTEIVVLEIYHDQVEIAVGCSSDLSSKHL